MLKIEEMNLFVLQGQYSAGHHSSCFSLSYGPVQTPEVLLFEVHGVFNHRAANKMLSASPSNIS